MVKFAAWFKNSLIVGCYPEPNKIINLINSKVKYIINVSDEPITNDNYKQYIDAGIYYHHFPMNEISKSCNIGINSIILALQIMYRAEKDNCKVYLHCHAGANRSPTVKDAYHYMRTGLHYNDTEVIIEPGLMKMFNIKTNVLTGISNNRLINNCNAGNLPVKIKMEKLLSLLGNALINKTELSIDKLLIDANIN